ncbi:MAG: prephenate dehydrogenase [Bacteroidetes bacterium]|nr:prephenate dehydrogenase [Bacteroidota bacterium]
MKIAIIGTGLIGGSIALKLKNNQLATHIIGVENNAIHAREALELKVVDEIKSLDEAIRESELIFLAIPVEAASKLILEILNKLNKQVLIDVGSTKMNICETVKDNKNRGRFVASHPMWGTEFSGPAAATSAAFAGNAVVICDKENSDVDALAMAEKIYKSLGMHIIYMDAQSHDIHAAYVSHISHITSFALANTVLEKEREESAIFDMASGGFESTVRLAKSNPEMWVPIFKQNRDNVLDVLNEHISQLKKFKSCLEKENYTYLKELIDHSNKIKKILK